MKLTELLVNQKVTIQLLWGEQKIEFSSIVVKNDVAGVYVNPYLHNGSELEINVSPKKGIICNLFTTNPDTNKRVSWKGIELVTVTVEDKILYCLKTNAYNHDAQYDDRRHNDRIVIHTKAQVFDGKSADGVNVIAHDISSVGISFYAPMTFAPKSNNLIVAFTDYIDDKTFAVRVECTIARKTYKAGNMFIGCKITGNNKDYQIYSFMKQLNHKNKNKAKDIESN